MTSEVSIPSPEQLEVAMREVLYEQIERRQQVSSIEYALWLKEFAEKHSFFAESSFGIHYPVDEEKDTDKIDLILDFIELVFDYFNKQGIDTQTQYKQFHSNEAEVIIGGATLTLGRMYGQGAAYWLRDTSGDNDESLASTSVQSVILWERTSHER